MTRGVTISKVRAPAVALVALIALGVLVGCPSSESRSDMSYSDWSQRDSSFAEAGDKPPTAMTLYAMARILAAQGRDEECRFVLGRIISEHPRFLLAYCELAELHLRHRRIEDAIATLAAALEVAPKDAVLLNDMGMCRLLDGAYDKALSAFTEAASVAPQDTRYRANMAVALGLMGRYEESITIYKQVVPEAEAHYNLSVLCGARGDTVRADQEYAEAVALGLEAGDAEQELPLPVMPP